MLKPEWLIEESELYFVPHLHIKEYSFQLIPQQWWLKLTMRPPSFELLWLAPEEYLHRPAKFAWHTVIYVVDVEFSFINHSFNKRMFSLMLHWGWQIIWIGPSPGLKVQILRFWVNEFIRSYTVLQGCDVFSL